MAKTKPQHKRDRKANGTAGKKPKKSPSVLLAEAAELLQTAQPQEALEKAQKALGILQPTPEPTVVSLPALNLLGEICVELGDADTARDYFTLAASVDPDGSMPEANGGGAEKFFWLAQLCEEGGAESVQWYEKGATVLRKEIADLEAKGPKLGDDLKTLLVEKRKRLANALCGVVEVYMTDLSWEEDAETRCEALVTEAVMVAPDSAETLQTLASVRISQDKYEDARIALSRSMELWKDLPPQDPSVPDFAARISLSRLLMEAEMEDAAIEVLERLVVEDDSSVEAWYLGGWCLHLLAEKLQKAKGAADEEAGESSLSLLKASRDWLQNSLKLYQMLEYEDERLRDHALELVKSLNEELGEAAGGEDEDEDDGWEDEGSGDEEMEGT